MALTADAYLCSYAKSGRTWMRFALANLLNDVYDLGKELDMDNMFSLLPNDDGPERPHPWKAIDRYRFAGVTDMPLIAMSHLNFDDRFIGPPVVFLVRNPLDTLVSWYYHLRYHEEKIDCDIDQFVVEEGVSDWIAYIESWLPHLKDNNILLVSYEELKRDPLTSFSLIASWFGIVADRDQLQSALDKSSFERMRAIEQESGVGHSYDRSDIRSLRVRKGKVGSWREEIAPQTSDYLLSKLSVDQDLWAFIEDNRLDPRLV